MLSDKYIQKIYTHISTNLDWKKHQSCDWSISDANPHETRTPILILYEVFVFGETSTSV